MSTEVLPATRPQPQKDYRLSAMQHLIEEKNLRNLPQSEQGQLEGYYDPESLSPEDELRVVPLYYDNKIPFQPDGTPFWERLKGEPQQHYEAFQKYLRYVYEPIGHGSTKHLETQKNLQRNPQAAQTMAKIRNLADVAHAVDQDPETLAALAVIYAWHYRAREYDLYRRREQELQREIAVQEMEHTHKNVARKLVDKVVEALEEMEPEELTPQGIKDFLTAGAQLERLSNRLDPQKPSPIGGHPPNQGRNKQSGEGDRDGNGLTVNSNGGTVQIQVVYDDTWRSS